MSKERGDGEHSFMDFDSAEAMRETKKYATNTRAVADLVDSMRKTADSGGISSASTNLFGLLG